MDITKVLIKSKVQPKNSQRKDEDQSKNNEISKENKNFNNILEKQKSVVKNGKEGNIPVDKENMSIINEDGTINLEELKGLSDNISETSKDFEDNFEESYLMLMFIIAKLLSGEQPSIVNVPKNADGSINIEELNNLIKEELNKEPNINNLASVSEKNNEVNELVKTLEKVIEEISLKQGGNGTNNDKVEKLGDLISSIKDIIEKPEGKVNLSSLKEEIKNILNIKGNEVNKPVENTSNLEDEATFDNKNSSSEEDRNITSKGDKNLDSKEEKFLNSIISEENKNLDKFSVNAFKANFGKIDAPKEAPVITKGNAVFDMIKTVKYMQTNTLKELTVKIYPKELGEITISISQDKDVMKANIKANTKDAYTLLNNNLVEIKKSLGEQNIKIQEVNISLYNDDTTFYREGEENRKSLFEEEFKKGKVNGIIQEDEEEILEYEGNVNALA